MPTTTKTRKLRWGRHALLAGFTGCKYPKDSSYPTIKKNDSSQEPQSWLSDYLQAVKILGGSKETTMQSLQLHLTGAARSWLSKLPEETIGSWSELTKQFTSNFRSTYKRPPSIEEVRAQTKKHNESLCSYIQCWSIIKNSPEDVSDKRAVDTFITWLRHLEFIEEMGRIRPKKVSELMDIANKFIDGKDTHHNKRTHSPEDDRSHRYSGQKCMPHNYENYSSHSEVAAGYRDNNNNTQGDERQSSGYRNDNRDDSSPSKPFKPRTSRGYNQPPEDILNGKRVSNH
jgi:hypothetical protein